MNFRRSLSVYFRRNISLVTSINYPKVLHKMYHGIPFIDFYEKTTGIQMEDERFNILKRRHPNIETINSDRISCIMKILNKFNVSAGEACQHPHVFTMNPISMDNYGEILRECGFVKILPQFIIRYHTIVRSRNIARLKKEGLISSNIVLEEELVKCFLTWPPTHPIGEFSSEDRTSILQLRMKILEKYLNWRLDVSAVEFAKYCKQYLVIRHRPMLDIQEAINFAQHEIQMSPENIRRNGFIISADPTNTKLIVEKVSELAGMDIRQVIRIVPAIVKNNYNAILKIRDILEEYRISAEAQKRSMLVYCMRPETVAKRLSELSALKEFKILSTNPRALQMVVHKRKMMARMERLRAASKQCYSLNQFVASSKVFNDYINNFGDRACGRDIAKLICSSLNVDALQTVDNFPTTNANKAVKLTRGESLTRIAEPVVTAPVCLVMEQLRRHIYWLHAPLAVVHENITLLQEHFCDDDIYSNCHLLLYPVSDIQTHLQYILSKRSPASTNVDTDFESPFPALDYPNLTDHQILSLVLYAIERGYHFTGDGIWNKNESHKPANKLGS